MTGGPARCRGVTLVETIVVLAILGILLAITLTAVQSAREAARRGGCAQNLSQFGTALGGYVSTKGSFPKNAYGASYSFLIEILPHLDQQPMFNSLNFWVDACDSRLSPPNDRVRKTSLPLMACPSDRAPIVGGAGWTSYAGNRGRGVQKYGYDGVFVLQTADSGMGIFTDGASQTAAMAEWSLGPLDSRAHDRQRTVFETPIPLTKKGEFERFREVCHDLDIARASPSVRIKGLDWTIAEFGNTLYNHTLPPNDLSCLNKTAVQSGAWTAGSQHPGGGANVLFVDGHVQWLRQGVAPAVWQALGSRNGGEIVGEGAY